MILFVFLSKIMFFPGKTNTCKTKRRRRFWCQILCFRSIRRYVFEILWIVMKICDKILIFKLLTYNNFCDFCLQLALADWVEVKESLAIYKHLNLKRRVCEISTYFSHLLSHQACFTTVIYVMFNLYKITSI